MHSIDFINDFSLEQNILLQYPKQRNAYVYKFYSDDEYLNMNFLQEKVYVTENQNEYLVTHPDLNVLKIEYDEYLAGKEIEIAVIDKEGNEYFDIVYLYKNKNIVYYKIDELAKDLNKVRFVLCY